LTAEAVDLIWAEAVVLFKMEEKSYAPWKFGARCLVVTKRIYKGEEAWKLTTLL